MSRVGIYVRNKDEVNIIEFMEHYYSLGFEFILILDDYSQIHPSSIIGNNFQGKYKIIQVNKTIIDKYPNKTDYLNNGEIFNNYILPEIKSNMDYCLYVDMDEYLVIKYINIHAVIDFYQPFDQLKINWLFFGNNDIKKCDDLSNLKNLFTKSALKLAQVFKSLVRVNSITNNCCPHSFMINGITKNILNEIIDSTDTSSVHKLSNYNYEDVKIYIAHYITQDTFSFIKRRFCRYTVYINIVDRCQNICDNSIIKNSLVEYMNNNIIKIVDYVHGDHEDINIFPDIYKEVLKYIKHNFFKGNNLNETINVDNSN